MTQVKSKPLLPCPFCGGNAKYKVFKKEKYHDPTPVLVYCDECGANSGFKASMDEAADAWNRRE